MARGRKTGGRQKGARNRATEEARAAAAATGTLPLHYMLSVMRDPAADNKRRDAMAMAAAPYLHPRLTAIDAKLNPDAAERLPRKLLLEFVLPTREVRPTSAWYLSRLRSSSDSSLIRPCLLRHSEPGLLRAG